jgi:hypothetical protein
MLSKSSRHYGGLLQTKVRGLLEHYFLPAETGFLPLVKRFMRGLLIFLANAQKGAYYLVLIGGLTT